MGLYIHVPYCIRKCRYCDFVSFEKAPEDAYFSMLAEEMGHVRTEGADSVFFGGGTPSLARKEQLKIVLDAVKENFGLTKEAEITIEVNPETVTDEKAEELLELGFNRVSMGVQSLDDRVLKALGRVHSADRARQAFRKLRSAGFTNINLDLIFGTPMAADAADGTENSKPGVQTLEVWQQTLDEVLDMRPEHISFYSLQLEKGTRLYKDYTDGKVDLPAWEDDRRMYHYAVGRMKECGYHHYELSNAALPGYECRHNMKYWTMQQYLGFGASAHSFIPAFGCDGRLEWAYRGEADWKGEERVNGFAGLEREAPEDLKGDFIFTQLRLIDGLDTRLYMRLFGADFAEEFGPQLKELFSEGLLTAEGPRIRFTEKGLDCTDPVIERLLKAL